MNFKEENKYRNDIGIYKITNIINGKCYVGQTSASFIKRYWHHKWCLNKGIHCNKYLQNAWNKYGCDNFIFEVIKILSTNEDIDELEKYYIKKYNSTNSECGYNIDIGGQPMCLSQYVTESSRKIVGEKNRKHMLGRKLSEETKAKMRASSHHLSPSDKTREKLSNYMKNRVITESTKQKIREANMGSNSHVTSLIEDDVIDIKKRLMKSEKQSDIANDYNLSLGAISAIANNRSWTHVIVDGWSQYISNKTKHKTFSDNDVRNIRNLLQKGYSRSKIARQYHCCSSNISNIAIGKTHKNVI